MNTPNAIITATDLVVRYNDYVILDRASISIAEGERVGLVGRNGSGKSTFLRLLNGDQEPDSGTIVRRRNLITSYLPQEFALESNKTVYENIHAGAKHVLDLIQEFETLPPNSKRHAELEERIQSLDGWNLENRIQTAMSHLNVPPADRIVDSLSGGEKRRVALCRAIISQPDFLILDEPTNHLDTDSTEWIVSYISEFRGTLLLVTHDRYFLDRVSTSIAELSNGTFYTYEGNYTDYLITKAERQAAEEVIENKRQSFLRRELDWVRRGPKARTTKSKSRLDQYYDVAAQKGPEIEVDVELVIPPPPKLGNRIVDLTGVGMTLGDKELFHNLNLNFEAGMKLGVTGRNGLGKTTLLKIILGEVTPTEGTVKIGSLTQFNYVDQGRLLLNEEKTAFEELSDGTEFVIFGEHRLSLRAYLKRFLFTDDRISTQVKYLSGGERSRLLLAKVLKRGGNFLILDEPTNDLDLATLRVLEEALQSFPGCVLVVSHDRYFLNRVCNGILAFEGNQNVVYSVGDYDYYLEKRAQQLADARRYQSLAESAKSKPAQQPKAAPSRPRKLTWKEARELEGMENEVMAAEEEISRIESLFSSADFHRQYGQQTNELLEQLSQAKEKLARLYDRWQELDNISKGLTQ